jgi:DHA2 family multidrug resistance protein
MSSATLPLASDSGSAIKPWFVGAAVVIPTLMGVVSTTIVGVARPYIAGGLSAPITDSEWVLISTSSGWQRLRAWCWCFWCF